jgi:hypothetical protein
MGDRIRWVLSAAFYLLALAATVSGYVSSTSAIILFAIATLLLLWAAYCYVREWQLSHLAAGKRGVEPWHLIVGGLFGVVIFALIGLGGVVWQKRSVLKPQETRVQPAKPEEHRPDVRGTSRLADVRPIFLT